MDPETMWSYADHPLSESWQGPCTTREEAIAEGRKEYEGESFWICSGTRARVLDMFPSATRLLEDANERANDECEVEDWPDLPTEQGKAFEAEYQALILKYFPQCPFWILDGEKEQIPRADACDAKGIENGKAVARAVASLSESAGKGEP